MRKPTESFRARNTRLWWIVYDLFDGTAFFTDYLMGDIYYRVNHPNENLDRATNQCAVLEGMLEVSIG